MTLSLLTDLDPVRNGRTQLLLCEGLCNCTIAREGRKLRAAGVREDDIALELVRKSKHTPHIFIGKERSVDEQQRVQWHVMYRCTDCGHERPCGLESDSEQSYDL